MRHWAYISIFMFALVVSACHHDRSNVVAMIENHPITTAELRHWMLLEKANVYSYFYRKHQVADSDNFWIRTFGNEIPLEKLKETALQEAARCKIQQILALEKGIIHTINFDELMSEIDLINAKRMQLVEKGEPIYGPKKFTARTYYSHLNDKMVLDLKSRLAQDELKPASHDLRLMEVEIEMDKVVPSGLLTMHYVDRHYEAYIDKLLSRASININHDVYDNLELN